MSTGLNLVLFGAGLASGVALAQVASSSRSPKPTPVEPVAVATSEKKVAILPHSGPTNEVLRLGFPGPIADVLHRQAYVTAYDRRLRHPAWTAQHLTAANLARNPADGSEKVDRSKSAFKEDPAIAPLFQSRLVDYFRSGYDRGHMVPAADAKRSQQAMDETFLLTNIAPQVGDGFNRHCKQCILLSDMCVCADCGLDMMTDWAYVEDFCRRLTGQFTNVFVFTVPLYLPKRDPIDGKFRVSYEVIGAAGPGGGPNVAVPTHFSKVILTSKGGMPGQPGVETSMGAFVFPNEPIPDEKPLTDFIVPVEAVEKAAGLTLFNPSLKAATKQLCQTTSCSVLVRRFDDFKKGIEGPKVQRRATIS